ncbi:MAG: hypothetical protein IJY17_05375 [Alphaproteobacteria bacterium]|nr:hypothetical protein [Alphaproteobacteria bacterium]
MSGNEEVIKNVPPTVEQPETTDLGYLRRLEKSVALLSKIAAVSVFSVVGSFCVVLALLPLKKTETVFVSMKDGQQMVRLLPQEIDRTTKEEYIRSVLFDYIRKRETINFVDEGERFAWVQAFTHPQWFKLFAEHMNSSNPDSPLLYYAKHELTRDIYVQTLESIPDTDHIWRAEYIATDRKSGQSVRTKSFVATFKAYTAPVQTDRTKASLNPFGLIVENYAVAAKGRPNDKDNSL